MNPKPLQPQVKPERLERKAVTIVLGLKTPQGVILAADTQETYTQSHKVNRPKLVYKADTNLCGIPLVLAVAGAGVGPWIDKLTTGMWEAIQDATNLDEACSSIEETITKQYRDFRDLVTFDPTADLIYAVSAPGEARMFYAFGPLVNEEHYRAAGSGQAIADFLLRHFNKSTHITNAMGMAIHVLMNAKRHSDGCGGDTHIAVVHNSGFSIQMEPEQVAAFEDVLNRASGYADMMTMLAGNPNINAVGLKLASSYMIEAVADELAKISATKGIKELLEKINDPPKQSVPQILGDQP